MTEFFQRTDRRTLLGRALTLLAGVFGFTMIDNRAAAKESASLASQRGEPVRLYARHWRVHALGNVSGNSSGAGPRMIAQGELSDRPDGEKLGEFHSTRFCLESAFGYNAQSASNLEFQTFKMKDGVLFGMAAGAPELECEGAHAILGGTGRFAGVRGSYVICRNAQDAQGPMEIVLTLT
jgi:hypothetical protein